MTAADRLDEIQARADAATDGPWAWEPTSPTMSGECWNLRVAGKPGIRFSVTEYQHGPDNAEFIAHARTDVPALVAALRAVLDLHVGVVDCCDECSPMKCAVCEAWEWPCDTVRAVEAALGEVAS